MKKVKLLTFQLPSQPTRMNQSQKATKVHRLELQFPWDSTLLEFCKDIVLTDVRLSLPESLKSSTRESIELQATRVWAGGMRKRLLKQNA